jgi:putative FmdB family regulatory protein
MPTYTYLCKKCSHEMDVFHAISATPKVECEMCGSKRTEKMLGTGAGIIFKGSGFYETDYKKNGKNGKDAKQESGSGDSKPSESKSESKLESKPDTKSQTKSSGKKSSKDAA